VVQVRISEEHVERVWLLQWQVALTGMRINLEQCHRTGAPTVLRCGMLLLRDLHLAATCV